MRIPTIASALLAASPILTPLASGSPQDEEPRQLVQELFLGETVFPQERGELQVTLAPALYRSTGADILASAFKLEYGITHRLQVEAEVEPLVVRSVPGSRSSAFGEVELGVRWSSLDLRGSGLHLSVGAGLGVRTGGDLDAAAAESERDREWEAGIVLGRDLGILQATAGLSAVGAAEVGPERGTGLMMHGALVMPIRRLRLSSEVMWVRLADASEAYVSPGLTACLGNKLEIGVATAFGIGVEADSFRLALRATYEFGGRDRD